MLQHHDLHKYLDDEARWHAALGQIVKDLYHLADIHLCFKDVDPEFRLKTPHGSGQHNLPYCKQVKRSAVRVEQCRLHDDLLPLQESPDVACTRRCPFGVIEVSQSIYHQNQFMGILHVGTWRRIKTPNHYIHDLEKWERLPVFNKKRAMSAARLAHHAIQSVLPIRHALENRRQSLEDPLIKEALHYIHHHLSAGLRVPEVAMHVGLSESRFVHRFNAVMQEGFGAYVRRMVMRQAAMMVANTEKPFYEISTTLGYNNANHFTQVFKQTHKKNPTAYRAVIQLQSP